MDSIAFWSVTPCSPKKIRDILEESGDLMLKAKELAKEEIIRKHNVLLAEVQTTETSVNCRIIRRHIP
jgi:hypothetical protein